jgi:LPS-assembly lipoprotein
MSLFNNPFPLTCHSRESGNPVDAANGGIPAFAGMTVIGVAILLLSACGFEPMYGTHSAATEAVDTALPNIDIGNIPDRDGQYLRNLLIDRLYTHGRPDAALYTVNFSRLTESLSNLGIDKEATATRAQIQIMTHMDLIDKSTGKPVLQRDLKVVGAYNLLDDQLSTLMSKQNITDSILQEMRDDAVTELSLYFRRKAMGEKTVNPPPAPATAPK